MELACSDRGFVTDSGWRSSWRLSSLAPFGSPAWCYRGSGPLYLRLFSLPIALVAVTFGTKGGVAAGLIGLALFAMWALFGGGGGGVGGWAGGTAMLVLGALLGVAVDSLAASEERARQVGDARRRLAEVADRRREAVEINDMLVQSAATAKWALEAGDVRRALAILDETVDAGQRIVTELINDIT